MNEEDNNNDLVNRIAQLEDSLKTLQDQVSKNNFSAHQDFNKYSNFTTGLKIPHFDNLPQSCNVGELSEQNGVLYICSSQNNWTLV